MTDRKSIYFSKDSGGEFTAVFTADGHTSILKVDRDNRGQLALLSKDAGCDDYVERHRDDDLKNVILRFKFPEGTLVKVKSRTYVIDCELITAD